MEPTVTELADCTASELAALYGAGAASPVEATRAVLARIDRLNPSLNACDPPAVPLVSVMVRAPGTLLSSVAAVLPAPKFLNQSSILGEGLPVLSQV